MAKYEKIVHGNFDEILDTLDSAVLNGSSSASFEDGSDYSCGDFRCAVRVYERFSYIGSNRVSMALTLARKQRTVFGIGDYIRRQSGYIFQN